LSSNLPAPITVDRLEHGLLERVIAGLCSMSRALGLPVTNLDYESVLALGKRKAKLSDIGDPRFLEPFAKALECYAGPDFSPLSLVFSRTVASRAVVNRVRIEEYVKQHPDVLDVPVERPIFVLGFPRTGTTLLQNLLCLDNDRRGLEWWELNHPAPMHPDPDIDRERRRRASQRDIDMASLFTPEMHQIHHITATTVEECWPLFTSTFAVLNFDLAHGNRGFGDWLLEYDMEWPYREYRRMLQILLKRQPARQLVLKCPEHLWFTDSLLKVFPDACIVWAHRDPFDAVASYCSMVTLARRTLKGNVDAKKVGDHIATRFHQGVTRAMAAMDGSDRVFHVRFEDLVEDPAATVGRIEEYFDLDRTSPQRVQEYLESPREDARGRHVYDPARYGLHADAIHEQFREYIDHFGVALHSEDPPEHLEGA
jgi:hypothetical protein